ncbi:MAG: hypothetical protein ABI591_06705 [Kofleriaceae bacterium]
MKYLVLVLLAACAGGEIKDTPENAECKALFKHLAQLEGSGADVDATVAKLPIEDFEGCTKSEPEIRACMMTAKDTAALKKDCLPTEAVVACMTKAKAVPEIRAKCWAGNAHAADGLKE